VTAAGGTNFVQSEWVKQVAGVVQADESGTFLSIRSNVQIGEAQVWQQALRLAMAFLKRYKMSQTLATVKIEYPECPKSTGFSRASEVEAAFRNLSLVVGELAELPFEERVAQFEHEIAPLMPKPKAQQKQSKPVRKGPRT
jgi:hypothetical protein